MQRTVLALLLVHINEVVASDRLIDELWGESPPETAHKTLQTYIYRLRKVLGAEVLASRGGGYVLLIDASALDAEEFEQAAAAGAQALGEGRAEEAADTLRKALALWRGRPFEDLAYEPCLQTEINRFEELQLAATENRIEAELRLGRHAHLVAELDALAHRFPLRERLRFLHMVALYRSGRQAEAVRSYQEARRVLVDELGLEPSPALQHLEQRILEQDPTLETDDLAGTAIQRWAIPEAKRNPYKGLRAFGEEDAADFFGRADLVRRLLERLADGGVASRLVALVGPSGSGKSSAVRAGLIPALKTGAVPGSTTWVIVDMYPAGDPFKQLAKALADAVGVAPGDLETRLHRAGSGIGSVLADYSLASIRTLVVIIDQFEELFTLVETPAVADRFLDLLVATLTEETSVRIVLTIRADFLGRPLQHAAFARLLEQGLVVVTPLSDHELKAAVTQPTAGVEVAMEPELVAELTRDVANRPAALPLLQYALTDLFDRRRGDVLTFDAYRSAGGILGALSRRASDLYDSLDGTERDAARQLFLRLVTVTDDAESVRRRVTRDELEGLPVDQAVLNAVLIRFDQHRLLTFDRHPVTGDRTVEVAHEALLTQWPELQGWIEQQREALLLHRRFTAARTEWQDAGRDPSYLFSGARLEQFQTWAESTDLSLTTDEHHYLAESGRHQNQQLARRRRRRRALISILAGVALVTMVLGGIALVQRDRAEAQRAEAEQQAQLARARELASAALANLEADPERSILLALEGVETVGATEGLDILEPVNALRQALAASRVVLRVPGGDFVDYSPDGSLLATGFGADAAIWDADTGQQVRVLPSPDGRIARRPVFSPNGRQLAVTYQTPAEHPPGQQTLLWDVATGEMVKAFEGPESAEGFSPTAVFSQDGRFLAVDARGPFVVWDVASGTERYRMDHGEGYYAWGPSFSPDGTLLAVTVGIDDPRVPARVVLYDASTGTEVDSLDVGELIPYATAFDPTGRYLAAVAQIPAGLLVWDVDGRELVASLPLEGAQTALAWSPDGEVIAISGNEGIPRLFDVATGDEVLALVGHDSAVWSLAFSPDGGRLAGAGQESDTLVWDVTAAGNGEVAVLATPYRRLDLVTGVKYDTGGDSILVVSVEPGGVARLDAASGQVLAAIPDQFMALAVHPILAPKAGLVASLNADGAAALCDSQTLEPTVSLPEGYFALAVSQDGTRVVLGSLDYKRVAVAEVGSWETLMTLEDTPICFADFSPDGTLLSAYNCDNDAGGVVDVENGSYLTWGSDFVSDDGAGWFVAQFSPDGSLVAVRTLTGRVGLLDIAALRAGAAPEDAVLLQFTAHNGAIPDNTPFSPDGSLFATWGLIDKHLRVWKTEDGQLVADLGETEANWPGFDFHPNGKHLIVSGAEGTLRVYTLDHDELVQIARSRVTRAYTKDECATYHIEPCPTLEDIKTGSA